MATRIPVHALRPLSRRCLLAYPTIRPFSSTRPSQGPSTQPNATASAVREDEQRSMEKAPSVSMAETASDFRSLPEDIGLLTGHFILPAWKNLPSFFGNIKYYWGFIASKPIGLYTRFQFSWAKIERPRASVDWLQGGSIREEAEQLYKTMYESFASADKRTIQETCLNEFASKLYDRIAARNNLQMNWQLEKFVSTRIVSHRGSPISVDGWPETGYRQVIIRIETDQVLQVSMPGSRSSMSRQAWKPQNAPKKRKALTAIGKLAQMESVPNRKRVVEYLVLQKRMIRGEQDKQWKIWGFASETTPESIKEEKEFEKNMIAHQDKKNMFAT